MASHRVVRAAFSGNTSLIATFSSLSSFSWRQCTANIRRAQNPSSIRMFKDCLQKFVNGRNGNNEPQMMKIEKQVVQNIESQPSVACWARPNRNYCLGPKLANVTKMFYFLGYSSSFFITLVLETSHFRLSLYFDISFVHGNEQ